MAAGLLEPLVVFWKEWGILVLVLLSFLLQVILLITAEIRRRKDSGLLKVVVWSAYLLADTTAIYALGHMSVISPTSEENQLMAFWAPFLLLHLGGQDNITAYSIEDNRLWLRHLQNLVVQVLAAGYVLYQSSIVSRLTLLRPAAILVFVVGVLKYGERVCALKHACSSDLSGKNYKSFVVVPQENSGRPVMLEERNSQIFRAHALLKFCKQLLKGPLPFVSVNKFLASGWEEMYGVAEMQLSLMHDVFYSKAELIHTWYGYCIRVFSLPATVTALLLFRRFSEKDGYRRADVAATYVLLAGAVVLEIASVLRAMLSTWLYSKFITERDFSRVPRLSSLVYDLVPHALARFWLRTHVVAMYAMCRGGIRTTTRYWSGSMGQHNIIHMCTHCKDSRGSKIARLIGREDWWNMLVYTSSIPVAADISELLNKQIKASQNVNNWSPDHNLNPDHIQNSRGRAALKRKPGLYEELGWSVDTELDKSILVWHIATHVYLSWYTERVDTRLDQSMDTECARRQQHLAQVTKELSNYMMFLLAARPYMLPGNASRQSYVQLCNQVIHEVKYNSEADLLRLIREYGDSNVTLSGASKLCAQLIRKELETPDAKILELISQVWVEMLCYAAYGCRPESHARQLSNGGEITTIVAIMLEYQKKSIVLFPESLCTCEPTARPVLMPHDRESGRQRRCHVCIWRSSALSLR